MGKWKLLIFLGLAVGIAGIAYVVHHALETHHEVVVVFGEDSSNLEAYESLKGEFFEQTGIEVGFQGVTFEQSIQKADAMFRNGGSDYDLILQYNFSLAPYVKNNYVAGIEDVIAPNVLRSMKIGEGMYDNALRETCFYYSNPGDPRSEPKQFGFPFAANTMLLVYNRDLFEDEQLKSSFLEATGKDLVPPTDWEDFIAVAEFFAGSEFGYNGICMQGASDGWLYYELCNYLFGMGTGTSQKKYGWEEGAPLTIATPENEQVLRYYKRLLKTSSGDFYTTGASQQQELMFLGKTAMCLMWSDYVKPLADSTDPRFGFAPIPGNISGLAGGAFYINRNSKHLQSASKFMLYALAPENQERLIEKGLCSAQRYAYTDVVLEKVPYARALKESLARGVFMFEAGTDAEIISSSLTTWVQKYIRGEISETEALAEAQAEVVKKRARQAG